MTLEEILTNRTRLSEEILRDVQGAASGYGVKIDRADVKDLVFPGNLQEIMNRVLAAKRMSQAQLVEARTKAEVQRIEAQTRADAEIQALEERRRMAAAYPAGKDALDVAGELAVDPAVEFAEPEFLEVVGPR